MKDLQNETILNNTPAIAFIPYGKLPNLNLSKVSLDTLSWPLGRPKRLAFGTISNMEKTDYLITHPRKSLYFFPRFNVKAQLSVVICEPDIIHKKYLKWSRFLNWRFFKILTKSSDLLSKINNGVFYLPADTFIENPKAIVINKTKFFSIIASKKRDLKGHKLRHSIVDFIKGNKLKGDVIGRGYQFFEKKEDGLANYYYSVVIENIQESNYFTEKIIDSFICETIPIYWGEPNISNHFDKRGIIICNTEAAIKEALLTISSEDYLSKMEWIKANKKVALTYVDYELRACKLIQESLK